MKVIDKDGNITEWEDPPSVKFSEETIKKALELGKTFRGRKTTEEISETNIEGWKVHAKAEKERS